VQVIRVFRIHDYDAGTLQHYCATRLWGANFNASISVSAAAAVAISGRIIVCHCVSVEISV